MQMFCSKYHASTRALAMLGLALVLLLARAPRAADLKPSFPTHALILTKPVETETSAHAAPRSAPIVQGDVNTPFTWDQTAVVYEATHDEKFFRGYDPNFHQVFVSILNSTPQFVRVLSFDGNTGTQDVQVPAKTAGNTDVFTFQVSTATLTSAVANFTYDIRATGSRIRTEPHVDFSCDPPNTSYVMPGQFVRYEWTPTTSQPDANCEADLMGMTAQATGLETSVITRVLGVKVRPIVLGHYLMLVTPRDVRGQPPLGSTSNGTIFRCTFGTDNLPPVTDGFYADDFTPAVNQTVTLQPNATDPETGITVYNNQTYEFGDGVVTAGVNGSTTHTYTTPGIFRVRCTLADNLGATATAEDTLIVGATLLPSLAFKFVKQIPPLEAGDGTQNSDSLKVTFIDPSKIKIKPHDRIIFSYNRNHFGRVSPSDNADDVDIVLGNTLSFSGKTRVANGFVAAATGSTLVIKVNNAHFDYTGDPRLGRCELKGIFENQRIGLCIIPADGSTPRVLLYTGNMQANVVGGNGSRGDFIPETLVTGTATLKLPNPRIQEP